MAGTQVLLGAFTDLEGSEPNGRLRRCVGRWDRMAAKLMLRVPVDLGYLEARNERMIVISLGNVVANEIMGARMSGALFNTQASSIPPELHLHSSIAITS